MNSRGATPVEKIRLGIYNISGPSNVQKEKRVRQTCADAVRNNNRIVSRDLSDDLFHVDSKSHLPFSTEQQRRRKAWLHPFKAAARTISSRKRNRKKSVFLFDIQISVQSRAREKK